MTTFRTSALTLLLACASATLLAAPAPWFKWRSKTDGKLVCHQTPLGPGWEKADGPYRDSHCTKLLIAKCQRPRAAERRGAPACDDRCARQLSFI